MALGLTQPLTEMRTRNLPGGKERPACKADNLTICEPIVCRKCGRKQLLHCCVCVCSGSHVIATQPVHWRAGWCLATVSARTYRKHPPASLPLLSDVTANALTCLARCIVKVRARTTENTASLLLDACLQLHFPAVGRYVTTS
jgi:hypothetical protein